MLNRQWSPRPPQAGGGPRSPRGSPASPPHEAVEKLLRPLDDSRGSEWELCRNNHLQNRDSFGAGKKRPFQEFFRSLTLACRIDTSGRLTAVVCPHETPGKRLSPNLV